MAAEFVAEGREKLVAEVGFAAGAEAIEEGGAEDGGRDRFVDGGFDGPAAFAGVGDATGELAEVGAFEEEEAARSRSQEEMTLPRRQTSVTSVRLRSYW